MIEKFKEQFKEQFNRLVQKNEIWNNKKKINIRQKKSNV